MMCRPRVHSSALVIAAGGLLLALFVGNFLGADEVVNSAANTSDTRTSSGEFKSVAEIEQLRRKLGSAWRGEAVGLPSAPGAESIPSDDEVIRTALVAQARESQFMPILPIQASPDRRAALREAAHQLDLSAHSLECQELYEQADELRGVAQRFRLQAREEAISHPRHSGVDFTPIPAEATD